MNVLIVESPAKARTIERYLGGDYTVLASFGHVRDLPSKDGSVRPDDDFEMTWEVDADSRKRMREISGAVKNADALFLATDPDREGEAISWHVLEILKDGKALGDKPVKRVVFNEITRSAVLDAVDHARDLDRPLIDAYLARRALDYLVGFTLSPVLWRKLPGSRSAGRVQSVALRLICDRELAIDRFVSEEYWSVDVGLSTPDGRPFVASLTHLDGDKLEKMSLPDEAAASAATAAIEAASFSVRTVESRPARRNPAPPFTTSTLQQEAARKLGFAASRTMRVAQRLYEGVTLDGGSVGLITYMRTDGVQIANEALAATRELIGRDFGANYLPESPRMYRSKAKNAQEAHEAIRPTDVNRLPKQVAAALDGDQQRLYDLIWKRAVASQMESARFERTTADITSEDGRTVLRARGSVLTFSGFLGLYQEGQDDVASQAKPESDDDRRLPPLADGDAVTRREVKPEQHFTEPPPRFTEASLVQKLEELGIGRPSTYASILEVLRARNYVRMDRNRFVPEDRGRVVTAFLEIYFRRYVEYDFTARMEELLDEVSAGKVDWKAVLRDFWTEFFGAVHDIQELRITGVLDRMNEVLGPWLFPAGEDGTDPRICPRCQGGQMSLKLGRNGPFIGCSNYPECRFTRGLSAANDEDGEDVGPVLLGELAGEPVSLRKGPYGWYLQLGPVEEGGKHSKRVSVPKDIPPDTVTFELACKLLALPREVGAHPEDAKPILAGIGRYGPYLNHEKKYARLQSTEEVFTVGLNRAVTLLAEAKPGRGRGGKVLRELGGHPVDGDPVNLMEGRYGPYVTHNKVNATIARDRDPETLTLEEAVELIAARAARPAKKKASKKKAGKKKVASKKKAGSKKKVGSKKKAASKKKASKKKAAAADLAQD